MTAIAEKGQPASLRLHPQIVAKSLLRAESALDAGFGFQGGDVIAVAAVFALTAVATLAAARWMASRKLVFGSI